MSAQPHGCLARPLLFAFDGSFDEGVGSSAAGVGSSARFAVGPVRSFSGLTPLLRAADWNSRNSVALTNGTKALPLTNTRPLGTLAASACSTSVVTGSRRKPISPAAFSASLGLEPEQPNRCEGE